MKRLVHLVLSLGTAGLMIMLLVMTIGAQAPDHVGGATIKVPGDYSTIQAAIDAAEAGDTIQVAEGTYKENLAIIREITLSGGWSADFTTREAGASTIDGQGLGRVISITTNAPSSVVTIDGFTIRNGDASGLGIPMLPMLADPAEHTAVAGLPTGQETAQDLDLAQQVAELRAQAADLTVRGLYPGGDRALQLMLEQLEWRAAQAERARTLANAAPILGKTGVEADPGAGGGIYSWNASLNLLNSTVEDNVGAVNSDGYGGGIFAGQGETITISGNVIMYNMAGMFADGRGGGLYLSQAPGAVVEDNLFLENAASNGGLAGTGGGLYVNESNGAIVQGNRFLRNTAHASWDCSGFGGGGTGGGAQIRKSDGASVKGNLFHNNLSAFHCGSHTGGLYVYDAADIQVSGNELIDNWGVLFQIYTDDYGGGLGLDTLYNATVTGNTIRSNVTSLATEDHGWHVSYGGGIYGHALVDGQISANTISSNTASVMLTAFGGGMYLESTNNVSVADNSFTDNGASLGDSGGGAGGGLTLRNAAGTRLRNNLFEGNRASAGGKGHAGALSMQSYGPNSIDNVVDANLFLDNQASGSPANGSQSGAAEIFSHGLAFTNNIVAGNDADEAGGLFLGIAENGEVTNNTLAGNSDAAILLGAWTTPVTFTNNIIVDHSVGISVTERATATLRYTLWDGNDTNIDGAGHFTETHSVSGDPAFVNPANHDYHLSTGSAAINAGDPAGVPPAPLLDLDDVERPQGSAVDIGAYEWPGTWSFLPIVATAPRLSIVPPTDYVLYEDFDGSWPGWTKYANTVLCPENCNEWEWNKSGDTDYNEDGSARINCYMDSDDIDSDEGVSSCNSTLYSPAFDAGHCADVILYLDHNYNFELDEEIDPGFVGSSGAMSIKNDSGWHEIKGYKAQASSHYYEIGTSHTISDLAAGKDGLTLAFHSEGYLNHHFFWLRDPDGKNRAASETYFQSFQRIDNVRVKCFYAQPDGTISIYNDTEYAGRGIYNNNGDNQTIHEPVDAGETAVFSIEWWNDGNYDYEDVVITGADSDLFDHWTVRYFANDSDITSAVAGDGWTAENISGGQKLIRVEITPDSSLTFGEVFELLISGTSTHDTNKVDAVGMIVFIGGSQLAVETYSVNEGASGRVTSSPVGIDCTDSCQAQFAPGTGVTLTAVPDPGYAFHAWYGEGINEPKPILQVTMDEDKSYQAVFSKPVIVTPDAGPGGSISPSEPTAVLVGSETFWDVTPDPGFQIKDVSITEGSANCWLDTRGAPHYRMLVWDEPPGYECTLSATFESQ